MDGTPDISELHDTAHVWHCSFSKNESRRPILEQLLSEDEKKKASKFKFKKDRNGYVISRGILRELLGSYLDISPTEIKFEYTLYGKPYLPNNGLNFNVSHSGDMAAFAFFLGSEIGVDIEKIKDDFDVLEIAQHFFSKNEIEAMENLPEEQLSRAFYRCWTRKESFIKAEGSGLSFPLNKFTVSLDNDHQATLSATDWEATEKSKWSLFSFVPQEHYIMAISVRKKNTAIQYFNWNAFQV